MAKKYGQTETEKFYEEMQTCREINKKIMDFGISQRQILRLVYLLSLELENPEHMNKISSMVKELENEGKLI